jgi:hypothetical protein
MRIATLVAAASLIVSSGVAAQNPALPFSVGERLTYKVSVAKLGNVGHGVMWIEGPVEIRGVSTWLLRFDFSAGKGPLRAVDQTSSWIDPLRMSAQRFFKREKHVLARHEERVEMFPGEKTWANSAGGHGVSPTNAPLDELSFMYFIRTLPLTEKAVYRFDRHFDVARSPTSLSVIRRERVQTSAGTFQTVLVEMRVKDPRRYKGEGIIRINLTDDAAHLPVRIQSAMPVIGTAVMTLESYFTPSQELIVRLD